MRDLENSRKTSAKIVITADRDCWWSAEWINITSECEKVDSFW